VNLENAQPILHKATTIPNSAITLSESMTPFLTGDKRLYEVATEEGLNSIYLG